MNIESEVDMRRSAGCYIRVANHYILGADYYICKAVYYNRSIQAVLYGIIVEHFCSLMDILIRRSRLCGDVS